MTKNARGLNLLSPYFGLSEDYTKTAGLARKLSRVKLSQNRLKYDVVSVQIRHLVNFCTLSDTLSCFKDMLTLSQTKKNLQYNIYTNCQGGGII